MFVAALGLTGGLAYTLIRSRSRLAAIIVASLIVPAAMWFCYPNMTPVALAPLLLVGLLTDPIARNDPPVLDAVGKSPSHLPPLSLPFLARSLPTSPQYARTRLP